jgi:uncharacterized protein (TIGR00730 family)
VRSYELGEPELDERISQLALDAVAGDPHEHGDADLVAEVIVTALKLLRDDADRGDLKLVNAALKEMRYAFRVFSRFRNLRKVTVYGSARTKPDDPNYLLADHFAGTMVDDLGWMVVTGAGPGIMEAANKGAGKEASFGVNIRLPFEDQANEFIHEHRLINFKYFFTRKLIFVKESDAFALFPGGFGTLDETFELLTLIQTGKSSIEPILLVESPESSYWLEWIDFVEGTLITQGMISPEDRNLFTRVTDTTEACDVLRRFYANFHSQRYVGDDLVLRLRTAPPPDEMQRINDEFADIVAEGAIEVSAASRDEVRDDDNLELDRIRLRFDRRQHGRLRQLVDRLNGGGADWDPGPGD